MSAPNGRGTRGRGSHQQPYAPHVPANKYPNEGFRGKQPADPPEAYPSHYVPYPMGYPPYGNPGYGWNQPYGYIPNQYYPPAHGYPMGQPAMIPGAPAQTQVEIKPVAPARKKIVITTATGEEVDKSALLSLPVKPEDSANTTDQARTTPPSSVPQSTDTPVQSDKPAAQDQPSNANESSAPQSVAEAKPEESAPAQSPTENENQSADKQPSSDSCVEAQPEPSKSDSAPVTPVEPTPSPAETPVAPVPSEETQVDSSTGAQTEESTPQPAESKPEPVASENAAAPEVKQPAASVDSDAKISPVADTPSEPSATDDGSAKTDAVDDWESKDLTQVEQEVKKHADIAKQANSETTKLIYSREYLLQFQQVCKDKPESLNLEVFASPATAPLKASRNNVNAYPKGTGSPKKTRNSRDRKKGGGGTPSTPAKNPKKEKPPKPVLTEAETVNRKALLLLNKLTPDTFNSISDQMLKTGITPEYLGGVVKMIFEKAVLEPKYIPLYSQLCSKLSKNLFADQQASSAEFKRILLRQCQQEFENRPDKSKLSDLPPEEQEEAHSQARKRMRGNMAFVGELFKGNIVPGGVIRLCLDQLSQNPNDAVAVEALCKLISTAGQDYEKHPKNSLSPIILKMKTSMINNPNLELRIRFMVQDLVELRDTYHWNPRREEERPVTIEEVHKAAEQKKETPKPARGDRPFPRGSGNFPSGGRGGSGSNTSTPRQTNKSSNPNLAGRGGSKSKQSKSEAKTQAADDGFTQVVSRKGGAPKQKSSNPRQPSAPAVSANQFTSLLGKEKDIAESKEDLLSPEVTPRDDSSVASVDESESTDQARIKNLVASTLEEFFGSGDLAEALDCVQEISSGNPDSSIFESIVYYGVDYVFVKVKEDPAELVKLLRNIQQVDATVFLQGVLRFLPSLEELSEEYPVAPKRLGGIIGKFFAGSNETPLNLEPLASALLDIDRRQASDLVSEMVDSLKIPVENIGIDQGLLRGAVVAELPKLLRFSDANKIFEFISARTSREIRKHPDVLKPIVAHVFGKIKKSIVSDPSPELLEEEKATSEKFIPLLKLVLESEPSQVFWLSHFFELCKQNNSPSSSVRIAEFLVEHSILSNVKAVVSNISDPEVRQSLEKFGL